MRRAVKNKRIIGKREVAVIVGAVILTVASIKAADNFRNKDEGNNGCPAEMVYISSPGGGFCIDRYEVSAGSSCQFTDPGTQVETQRNIENTGCQGTSRAEAVPWRFISQNQAAVVCAKSGKRLPSNKEWFLAAMSTPDKTAELNLDDCQTDSNWDIQPGKSGSGKKCVSGSGVYDMIGNVWEWVDGTINDGQLQEIDLPEQGYIAGMDDGAMPIKTVQAPDENYNNDYFWIKNNGVRGIARGGYWANKDEGGLYSVYMVAEPSYAGTGIGFRCVK